MHISLFISLVFLVLSPVSCGNKSSAGDSSEIKELKAWIASSESTRKELDHLNFSTASLSKKDAEKATVLLLKEKQSRIVTEFGAQWDARVLQIDSLRMPFYYQTFGVEPKDGRSLFISMHGGGNAEAEVNDQQYLNQQHLYDAKMKSMEGIYLAPRAASDSWNLWHESHIDEFFNLFIQLAVLKENVNPNKVYLLGYSAGGDGTYQLAPRMGDRWAAASMMAGHPNETSPLGLRNTPFAIQMGALDAAYDRNKIAKAWEGKLDSLQESDPNGYQHFVKVHEGKGHWMEREDSLALTWMAQFQRNPIPNKVVWKQDDRHHSSFFWMQVPEDNIETGGVIVASFDTKKNQITIHESYTNTFKIRLNDQMLNLDKTITVKYKNKLIFKGKVNRTIKNIYSSMSEKGDASLTFPAEISFENFEIVKD